MAPRLPTDGRPPEPPGGDGSGTSKRAMLEASLAKGRTLVYLDARRPGVRVPERLAGDHQLALALSYRFPDTQMVVNERGVAATLRFSGVAFRCVMPWASVWGMMPAGADQPVVWPHDLPEEFGGSADGRAEEPPPVERGRPKLSVVAGGAADPAEESEHAAPMADEAGEAAGRTARSTDDDAEAAKEADVPADPSPEEPAGPRAVSPAPEPPAEPAPPGTPSEGSDGPDRGPTPARPRLRLVR